MDLQEQLQSFPFDATVNGTEHHYRITVNEHHFRIEQDGVMIATLQNKEGNWMQLSGTSFGKELLESLCDHIDAYYCQTKTNNL
jgi:hypothetical protein